MSRYRPLRCARNYQTGNWPWPAKTEAPLIPCYALYVSSEALASDDLARMGLECWTFTYKRFRAGSHWALRNVNGRVRHASRPARQIETPIYPGYVFARIPPERLVGVLERARVIDVVRGPSGDARPMPEDLIGDMIVLVMSGKLDEVAAPPPKVIGLAAKPIVPKNRARSRKKRNNAKARLKKWLAESDALSARLAA